MLALTSINPGAQTNRETALLANRMIPRQKVLNVKSSQNVPMTVTNKERESFKFSTTHLMQKMLTNNSSSNATHQPPGSVSTRNLSLAQLHQNKEAAQQNQQLVL